ncbi:MAG: Lrp/AsnC family transcriptional regulator, partial [Candidatus Micrarchaeaceae archaeon]
MKKLPSAVADALEKARKELGSNVSISRLNGHYYVYRRSTRWDKEKKKVRSIAEYLGKITDDGTFIRKGMVEGDLEHARELIIARGGSVTLPEATAAGRAALSVSEPLNATDRKILTALSMNSRASLGLIGRLSGLKPSSVHYRIKQLEERFGIRYIAEPSIIKLGYLEYIALLRFVGKRPDVNALKDAFSKVHNVQLVLLTSGRYDMVIRFVARSNENSSSLFYSLMKDDTIGEYDMGWTISPFFSSYGFVPLREEFYDLLKERIWKRSKDTPRMLPGQITEREHAVLRELNSGANKDFTDIDKRLGLERGTSRYTYYRLVEQGILVRPTITMTHPGARYN